MQQITITGYLSKDAESATTQSGQNVTRWNVPVRQGWGEREQTNWFRVSIWGKRAEFSAKARKGEFVTVTGELSIGEYQGKPQYEINATDFQNIRTAPRDADGSQGAPTQTSAPRGGFAEELDDNVPFLTFSGIY